MPRGAAKRPQDRPENSDPASNGGLRERQPALAVSARAGERQVTQQQRHREADAGQKPHADHVAPAEGGRSSARVSRVVIHAPPAPRGPCRRRGLRRCPARPGSPTGRHRLDHARRQQGEQGDADQRRHRTDQVLDVLGGGPSSPGSRRTRVSRPSATPATVACTPASCTSPPRVRADVHPGAHPPVLEERVQAEQGDERRRAPPRPAVG